MDGKRPGFILLTTLVLKAALAASIPACVASSASAETGASMIAIDQMKRGSAPAGFTFARTGRGEDGQWSVVFARTGRGEDGQWSVVEDDTASAGQAIEQVSADRTDYRFPLAIPDSFSAADLEVEIHFKAVGGRIDQAAGIAVRLLDPDNYYVARANAMEDNVRFYRVVNGRREQLGGADLKVTANEWHTLGLRAEGERFTVSYDGNILFSVIDQTFGEAGGVALWTKADSVTRFDQVKITALSQAGD